VNYYPLFVNLQEKRCVVIGGGRIAQRKVMSLLGTGVEIQVISPESTERIKQWWQEGRLCLTERGFLPSDIEGATIVIAATNHPDINLEVYHSIKPGQWINIVDRPDLCSFIVPSIVRRGDLTIAISTAGKYPGLAKQMRKKMEHWVGEDYNEYTTFLGNMRTRIMQLPIEEGAKRYLLQELLDEKFREWTKSGEYVLRDQEVKKLLDRSIP
jgi:precorrin-2 dehydrogenase / sirohydrochlorin ferrochelatase